MKVTYKRELSHSYLVIANDDRQLTEKYRYRMMAGNRIGKLLELKERQLDGESWLYYDISSRQPIERFYDSVKMSADDLKHVITAIEAMQEDLAEYLLDEEGLMLDSELLFTDMETEELYFCYHPGRMEQEKRYENLADFFLEHVDHAQEHAVNIAYQFYKLSKSEFFVLSSFRPYLEKETAAEVKQPPREEIFYPEQYALPLSEHEERKENSARTKPEKEKRKGLFSRILKHKEKDKPPGEPEEWPEQVWDSYAAQPGVRTSGETVYFTDLEKPGGTPSGRPCIKEVGGERIYFLEGLPMTVGKVREKSGILLEDSSVSRLHARFESGEKNVMVQDLNSRNGTLVNGRKLLPNESVPLKEGDMIQFGRERFLYGFIDSKAF